MTNDPGTYTRRSLLRGLAAGSAACILGDFAGGGLTAAAAAGGRKLPRVSPGEAGIDPAGIMAFVNAVEAKLGGLHSLMLLRHGQVAAEGWWAPYGPEHPHMLFSLSKSFASTGIGLAVAQGLLTVDAPVTSFFPEQLPDRIGANLKAMKVRHLLSMSTGHEKDATGPTTQAPDGDCVKAFLALPVEHAPGSRFVYNSAATYMLSAIVQKLTGVTLLEYLRPRLLTPLGIEGATWETCPRGINRGGWGLSVKTEDIARFGQLYLQRGKWNGQQVLPESWVSEATSRQIANGTNPSSDWAQGYGYQFWRCRHGAYRGDGAFGQFCVVMPEQDAVLAITSGLGDMQAVLNLTWEHLLPAMGAGSSGPSAGTPADLKRKLADLQVPQPEGSAQSAMAETVSGKTYRFEPNDDGIQSASLSFRGDRCTVTLRDADGERRIRCGGDRWIEGTAPLGDRSALVGSRPSAPVAVRGAWQGSDTYTMKLCFYETPFIQTLTWRFTGDGVTVTRKTNVGFGPTDRPPLTGKAA